MPLFLIPLVTWLANAIGTVMIYMATVITKKIIGITIVIALMATAITFFFDAVEGMMPNLAGSALDIPVSFLPSNTGVCVAAIISTHLACMGFSVAKWLINRKAQVMLA